MVIFKVCTSCDTTPTIFCRLILLSFDMKSMSIKFDNDILTSFSQAFEIEMYNYWLSNINMQSCTYLVEWKRSIFTGLRPLILQAMKISLSNSLDIFPRGAITEFRGFFLCRIEFRKCPSKSILPVNIFACTFPKQLYFVNKIKLLRNPKIP